MKTRNTLITIAFALLPAIGQTQVLGTGQWNKNISPSHQETYFNQYLGGDNVGIVACVTVPGRCPTIDVHAARSWWSYSKGDGAPAGFVLGYRRPLTYQVTFTLKSRRTDVPSNVILYNPDAPYDAGQYQTVFNASDPVGTVTVLTPTRPAGIGFDGFYSHGSYYMSQPAYNADPAEQHHQRVAVLSTNPMTGHIVFGLEDSKDDDFEDTVFTADITAPAASNTTGSFTFTETMSREEFNALYLDK